MATSFLPKVIGGGIALFAATLLSGTLASYTGLGWGMFLICMIVQLVLAVLAIKRKGRLIPSLPKGKIPGIVGEALAGLTIALILNWINSRIGWLPRWEVSDFCFALLGIRYGWWAIASKKFTWFELLGQFVAIVGALSVLVLSSAPYDAVGESLYQMAERAGLLNMVEGWGVLGEGVRAIVRFPQHLATLAFAVSTYHQIAPMFMEYKSDEARDQAIFTQMIAYCIELVLAYIEYPFVMLDGQGIPLAQLGENLGGVGVSLSVSALAMCLASVALLDIAIVTVLHSAGLAASPTPRRQANNFNPRVHVRGQPQSRQRQRRYRRQSPRHRSSGQTSIF